MKFKKSKKEENILLYIPNIKHNNWETHKGKVCLIFHHNKPIEKFIRWLFKKPRVSDMTLDEMGSAVWKLIDGKNNIYDIGQKLIEKFGKDCEPVYDRLIMYVRYMNKRGWIYFTKETRPR